MLALIKKKAVLYGFKLHVINMEYVMIVYVFILFYTPRPCMCPRLFHKLTMHVSEYLSVHVSMHIHVRNDILCFPG